jgi:hypothetical protein
MPRGAESSSGTVASRLSKVNCTCQSIVQGAGLRFQGAGCRVRGEVHLVHAVGAAELRNTGDHHGHFAEQACRGVHDSYICKYMIFYVYIYTHIYSYIFI